MEHRLHTMSPFVPPWMSICVFFPFPVPYSPRPICRKWRLAPWQIMWHTRVRTETGAVSHKGPQWVLAPDNIREGEAGEVSAGSCQVWEGQENPGYLPVESGIGAWPSTAAGQAMDCGDLCLSSPFPLHPVSWPYRVPFKLSLTGLENVVRIDQYSWLLVMKEFD